MAANSSTKTTTLATNRVDGNMIVSSLQPHVPWTTHKRNRSKSAKPQKPQLIPSHARRIWIATSPHLIGIEVRRAPNTGRVHDACQENGTYCGGDRGRRLSRHLRRDVRREPESSGAAGADDEDAGPGRGAHADRGAAVHDQSVRLVLPHRQSAGR